MLTSLGPYRIESELGSGGMGKVYAARVDEHAPGLEIGARVALKVVHPHLLETPGFFRRFLREAEIGSSVRHPNIVRTFGCDQLTVEGVSTCYMVMEYVEGQTLTSLAEELERVPEELCRHVAREVCRGLDAIHAAGAVHRDIKPDNVLITPDHDVKLMDLGVALLMDEAVRLSRTGAFVGSVEYAAPEQFDGGDVDGRTDLYSLGVALYELATGVHPNRGGGFHAVLRRVLHETPRPLGEVNPQLSAFFEEVVHSLLIKDPRGRFASAARLLEVLEGGEESEWWRARARSLQEKSKRPIRRIRIPRHTAVYGREKELAVLRGLHAKAKAGDGQVVLIEGEAGIGKSRLVDEMIGRLQSEGEDLNFLFGSYPPNGAATASGAFSSAYREHFGASGSAAYLEQTPILVSSFDALLAGESAPSGAEQLTKDSLQTCFVNATRALAAERVTVVLIDDLHFAPDEGRALFTSMALAAPGHRVLLIGTTRPVVTESWQGDLDRFDHTTRLAPQRLAAKDLVRLLEDSFQSKALAESLGLQIMVKSDGNPFFAFEIIRGLREGQFIAQKPDGSWAGTQVIDDIQIPSSVLDLVKARVANLTEDERDLLDVACCWGFEFDPGLVGDVLGLRRIPLLKRFGQIERAHRLVRASGRNYVFDHHQVQEALYGSLHEQLREEYHAELAAALETRHQAAEKDPETLGGALCVDLCEHYLKGAQGTPALRYLPAAEAHLNSNYLHAQVVALADDALAVPGLLTGVERARALVRLAKVNGPLDQLGRPARQEELAREAEVLATEAGDTELRGSAANALGNALRRASRYAEAEPAYRRALAIAIESGDREAEATATGDLGTVYRPLGRLAEAAEHFERDLELSRQAGDREGEARATGNLGSVLHGQGRLAEARAQHERYLALSRAIGHRLYEAIAMVHLGVVAFAEGRLDAAERHYELALSLLRDVGNRGGTATALGNLGNVLWSQGRLAEAEEHHQRHLALAREIGDREGEIRAAGNLGNVLFSQGRLAEAREHFARHLELSSESGFREGEAVAHLNLGAVLREQGETACAEQSILAAVSACEEIGNRLLAAAARLALGSLRVSAGEEQDGRASLSGARDLAVEYGFPRYETLAHCELACLPGSNVSDSLAVFEEHQHRLDAAQLREARFLLWRATGDRAHLAAAKSLLDQAVTRVDRETRDCMFTKIRLNRDIVAASEAEFGADGRGAAGESPTRAG